MSFSHHAEPRNQVLFEGGELGTFSELRLLGQDGTLLAAGSPVPSVQHPMQLGPGSKGQPPPVFGALRVTLSLASQQQLSDVLRYPERYRVEVLTRGRWQAARFVFECSAQE